MHRRPAASWRRHRACRPWRTCAQRPPTMLGGPGTGAPSWRYLGEHRQALRPARCRVGGEGVVACLPPCEHIQVHVCLCRQRKVLLQVIQCCGLCRRSVGVVDVRALAAPHERPSRGGAVSAAPLGRTARASAWMRRTPSATIRSRVQRVMKLGTWVAWYQVFTKYQVCYQALPVST